MGINLQTAAGQQWAWSSVRSTAAAASIQQGRQVREAPCRAKEKWSVRECLKTAHIDEIVPSFSKS